MSCTKKSRYTERRRHRLFTLSREYPLALITIALCLGQWLAYLPRYLFPIILCALIGGVYGYTTIRALTPRIKRCARRFAWYGGAGLGCGWVLLHTQLSPLSLADLPREGTYYVQLLDESRRHTPGAVSIGATFLSYLDPKSSEWIALSPPRAFVCKTRELPWRNTVQLSRKSHAVVFAKLSLFSEDSDPFSYEATLQRDGYVGRCAITYSALTQESESVWIYRVRELLREKIGRATEYTEKGGLILSMVWGMEDTLSLASDNSFTASGLTHLLVVSGAQVVLLYSIIIGLHSLMLPKLFPTTSLTNPMLVHGVLRIMGIGACTVFVLICGVQTPAVRALCALSIWSVSQLLNRGERPSTRLLLTFFLLQIIYPASWMEPGVQLTFAALIGLSLGSGITRIGHYLSSCWYAWVGTTLISVLWFQQISLWGIILNPLFVPLVTCIGTYGGIVSTGVLFVLPSVGSFLIQICATCLWCFLELLHYLASLSFGYYPIEGAIRWLLILLCLIMFLRKIVSRVHGRMQGLPRSIRT